MSSIKTRFGTARRLYWNPPPSLGGEQRTCFIADPERNIIEIDSRNKPYKKKTKKHDIGICEGIDNPN